MQDISNRRGDAYQAFVSDPYGSTQLVSHEYREDGARANDGKTMQGVVLLDNVTPAGNRFVGLVEKRDNTLEVFRDDALRLERNNDIRAIAQSRVQLLGISRANRAGGTTFQEASGVSWEPRDRHALLPDNDRAYRDSLVLTDKFYVSWRLTLPPQPPGDSTGRLNVDELPLFVFLHGVPTNMDQMEEVHRRVARYAPVLRFDMLGMGHSDKPRFYQRDTLEARQELNDYLSGEIDETQIGLRLRTQTAGKGVERAWDRAWLWRNDIYYIDELVRTLCGELSELGRNRERKFIFVADDWGGGQLAHYAEVFDRQRLLGACFLNPIAFDGYPVHEIQAFGRASLIEDDATFMQAMAAADQTMVQILKTMSYDNTKIYNQYSIRGLVGPYASQQYVFTPTPSASAVNDNVLLANSKTMQLNYHALRVLADRAAVLGAYQLLPVSKSDSDFLRRNSTINSPSEQIGVDYQRITTPTLVLWGEYDNMMPELQRYRYAALIRGEVEHRKIPRAGHFSGDDNPTDVAENLLNWVIRVHGPRILQQAFLGLSGIQKGDEEMLRAMLGTSINNGTLKHESFEQWRTLAAPKSIDGKQPLSQQRSLFASTNARKSSNPLDCLAPIATRSQTKSRVQNPRNSRASAKVSDYTKSTTRVTQNDTLYDDASVSSLSSDEL